LHLSKKVQNGHVGMDMVSGMFPRKFIPQ
jgi:hypothetical protein